MRDKVTTVIPVITATSFPCIAFLDVATVRPIASIISGTAFGIMLITAPTASPVKFPIAEPASPASITPTFSAAYSAAPPVISPAIRGNTISTPSDIRKFLILH